MVRCTLIAAAVVSLATAVGLSADDDSAQPGDVTQVAAAENLVAGAEEKIAKLKDAVADQETFDKSSKKIRRDAGMLAVFAQALAEHKQDSPVKNSAGDLRDAAVGLAAVKSHGDTGPLMQAIEAARTGKSSGAAPQGDWAKLIDFDSLMSEVADRNRDVGRAARKMRRGLEKADREAAARDAEVLALTAHVIAADVHDVGEGGDVKTWKQYAADQRTAAIETAAAFRDDDGDAVKAAYAKLRKSCSDCHKDFRD